MAISPMAGAITILLLTLAFFRIVYRRRRLPPGPRGLPVIGNAFQMPQHLPWLKWAEWGHQYGDIIYLENFGKPLLLVHTYDAACELLRDRVAYAGRPHSTVLNDLMDFAWSPSFMPNDEYFRKHRLMLDKQLNSIALQKYYKVQVQEKYTHKLLLDILNKYDKVESLKRWSGGIMLMMTFGHAAKPENDPMVLVAENAAATLSESLRPGAFLVESFPWLRYVPEWFPGGGFQAKIRAGRQASHDVREVPYAYFKNAARFGVTNPSITSGLLEDYTDVNGVITDEDVIKNVVGTLYGAGFETVLFTVLSFMLAMVTHPDAQTRAQDELDCVVGRERLPSFEDRPSLPYIDAIVKESMRWNPVTSMGMPRRLEQDDVYKNHFIPAGTTAIPNHWAMTHDPEEYPDPLKFCPERFLPEDEEKIPLHPNKIIFGFGRRICPGRQFAENSIFIAIASLLAAFDFKKAKDAGGNCVEPAIRYTSGFMSAPEPFECIISPRSPGAAALVRQATE